MSVKEITSEEHFQTELLAYGSKLIVVDFSADWCMPCRRIAPIFQQLATKYPRAVFLKVDINQCEDTATRQGISVMPTFIFFKNKAKLDKLQGANETALEEKIKHYYVADDGCEDEKPEVPGQIDLIMFILKEQCKALNESDDHPFAHCLSTNTDFLESDSDEQLILPFNFTQAVKIHSIKIRAPADKGPKTLKLFINQPIMLDFDSANSNQPVQEIILTEEDLKEKPVNLKYLKFQNVQNLHVFVKDNQSGNETTQIDYFQLIGTPTITIDMNDFKRVAGKIGEAH